MLRSGKTKFITMVTLMTVTIICCFSLNAFAATGLAKIINAGDMPTKPGNLEVSVKEAANGNKYFNIKWDASKDVCSGIKEYKIYRNDSLIATTKDTDYADYDVNNLTKYRYKVYAIDNNNHYSLPSQSGTVTLEKNPHKKILNVHTKEIKYISVFNNTIENVKRIIHVQNNTISYKPLQSSFGSFSSKISWKNMATNFDFSIRNGNSVLSLSSSLRNFLNNR